MSDRFNSDEEMLARLVREAGDPSVSPDPQYADTLRATILDRLAPTETPAPMAEAMPEDGCACHHRLERTRKMKRIAKFAVAATILVALGIAVFWITIGGGSTSVAFARVAEALDSLKSATFDVTEETKGDEGQPSRDCDRKRVLPCTVAPTHRDFGRMHKVVKTAVRPRRNHVRQRAAKARLRPQPRPAMAFCQ